MQYLANLKSYFLELTGIKDLTGGDITIAAYELWRRENIAPCYHTIINNLGGDRSHVIATEQEESRFVQLLTDN